MALSALAFQAAVRQWCQWAFAEDEVTVILASQGEVANLAQWSIAGLGLRQQVVLNGNECTWTQPNGKAQSVDVLPQQTNPLWQTLEQARQTCVNYESGATLPFYGGLVGLLSYEASSYCDSAIHTPKSSDITWPVMHWVEYNQWAVWDHATQTIQLLGGSADWRDAALDCWDECVMDAIEPASIPRPAPLTEVPRGWQVSATPETFAQQATTLIDAVHQGEFYQANLSLRLQAETKQSPWGLFEFASQVNPSPFAGFFKTTHGVIVSNSPERLVRVHSQPDGVWEISTRPIAGTRGRGQTATEDAELAKQLAQNEKERAEHLMLVDLLRNDVGRVSEPGSVVVDELMVLERYSHVTHLVSNVVGRLQPQVSPWDVIRAMFPGGTITGCPKVRCCQWLADVESVPRGFYTGSLGYICAKTGQLDFNILIRTLGMQPSTHKPDLWQVSLHAGAGIVADSVPENEYRECLKKASALASLIKPVTTSVSAAP